MKKRKSKIKKSTLHHLLRHTCNRGEWKCTQKKTETTRSSSTPVQQDPRQISEKNTRDIRTVENAKSPNVRETEQRSGRAQRGKYWAGEVQALSKHTHMSRNIITKEKGQNQIKS